MNYFGKFGYQLTGWGIFPRRRSGQMPARASEVQQRQLMPSTSLYTKAEPPTYRKNSRQRWQPSTVRRPTWTDFFYHAARSGPTCQENEATRTNAAAQTLSTQTNMEPAMDNHL